MTAKNHEAYGVATQKALNLSPPRMGLLKSPDFVIRGMEQIREGTVGTGRDLSLRNSAAFFVIPAYPSASVGSDAVMTNPGMTIGGIAP